MSTNMFEYATRAKLRFPSIKGELTVEQLWDLPLQAKTAFDLDNTARAVNAELKSVTEDSFVATKPNPAKADLEIKLELVKHIISVRMAENEAARNALARKAEKEKLMGLLEKKQDAALESLSTEEIQKRLDALNA